MKETTNRLTLPLNRGANMTDDERATTIYAYQHQAVEYRLQGEYTKAIGILKEALSLIDNPIYESKYAFPLFANIGENFFLQNKLEDSLEHFGYAIKSRGGLGEPAIHLRIGQIRYEFGQMEKAKDELMRAYMGGGTLLFDGIDSKYFDLIRPII